MPLAAPRVSVIGHYALVLVAAIVLAVAGWAPWAVTPLFALLLGRVILGTRPSAAPDRTVLAIGLGEGIVSLATGAWVIAAFGL